MRVLLTGCAGFIGSHLLCRLLAQGHEVLGVDNFDPFYAKSLKLRNLEEHTAVANFQFLEADLADSGAYKKLKFLIGVEPIDAVIHLAAKAGVRPSIEDPLGYQRANVIGTQNLLEFARDLDIKQFVFASSSSVYGVNPDVPWKESNNVIKPISPYASTKVSGELLGHVYSHLFGIRFVALRFFTVYGPRQRPDLAINKFVRHIDQGQSIPVFGDGSTRRDYTYVEDTVSGILAALEYKDSIYEIFNLGNDQTVTLKELIQTIESVVGKKACMDRQPEQPGDVPQTWAEISKARDLLGYNPQIKLREGIEKFYDWWRSANQIL